MKNYTIVPLDVEHLEEICEDIKYQAEAGIAECALFSMQLQPLGNPPVMRAEKWGKQYELFRNKLEKYGIGCGVLVQNSMANGTAETPIGKFMPLRTGEVRSNVYCPSDPAFLEFMANEVKVIATYNPVVIMLDDDIRLMTQGSSLGCGGGCGCDFHMSEFNRRAGTNLSRTELLGILSSNEETPYKQMYLDVQRDSLVDYAKCLRKAIDSVNPKIQGAYCTVGGEFAGEIAEAIAGEGNPVVLRINNGNYGAVGMGLKPFTYPVMRAASQVTSVKGKVDVILAETDTCPHNRYSKSASSLHAHFVSSILEGAQGAKHWLQRMGTYEPNSGKAYRKILEKHTAFYNKLIEIVPSLDWLGCRIPIPRTVKFDFTGSSDAYYPSEEGWAMSLLERMGIPVYFSAEDGGTVCLNGKRDAYFTDEEIKKMLSGNVFLASDTAKNLIDRGFGSCLGVEIRDWNGESVHGEMVEGGFVGTQIDMKELIPINEKTIVDSKTYHSNTDMEITPLFPATTIYENEQGGNIVVFCGTPKCTEYWASGYSFLNETRKKQLVKLLTKNGDIPVYYPGDAEVYLKAATMPDNKLFCAIFNVGLDTLEEIELVIDKNVLGIEKLMPDGTMQKCDFENKDGNVIVKTSVHTLDPVILTIKQ